MHEHPRNMMEALASRKERYAMHTCEELKADAHRDMLELLNVYTDILNPDCDHVAAMGTLAKAISRMEGGGMAGWEAHFPEIAHALHAHRATLDAFFNAKAHGHDASAHIAPMFEAHARLAGLVKAMCVTDAEKAAIMAAVAK